MKKRGKSKKTSKLKQYKITNKLISEWFGYSNPASFNSSKAKQDMLDGINEMIYHIEYQISRN